MPNTDPHAYLIVHGSREVRLQKALKKAALASLNPQPDVLILQAENGKAIGIDEIRTLKHQLSLRPHQEKIKKVLILEAQFLTVEAQNALLKTLEEPPGATLIVLTAPHPERLLPTISSRCQIIRLPQTTTVDLKSLDYQKNRQTLNELLQNSRSERLIWSENNKKQISSREASQKTLTHWLAALREIMLQEKSLPQKKRLGGWLQKGLTYLQLLETTNVTPRLVVENFLLAPSLGGAQKNKSKRQNQPIKGRRGSFASEES